MGETLNKELLTADMAAIANIAKQPANEMAPYYDETTKGLFYVTRSLVGDEVIEKRLFLTSGIEHKGGGKDDNDSRYAIIERLQQHHEPSRIIVLPLGDIGTAQCRKALQNAGVMVDTGKRPYEVLGNYLQRKAQAVTYRITDKGGWHHNEKAYILPSGEVLTNSNNLNVIYNGDKTQAEAFNSKGTVASWNDAIGKYVAGNSRLCLAVGTALAAPLLKMLSIESGGFHIFGDSSDGKTTAAKVALSVWANPFDAKVSWNGTGGAFGGVALSRNDNFMMLDEVGEATQQDVHKVAYGVLNGTERARLTEAGQNRPIKKWRVLVFSTGEKTIKAYIGNYGRQKWQAGQETRLPSIPANAGKGLGVFDTIHGFGNGQIFADHLNDASMNHYGTMGVAFITYLLNNQEAASKAARAYMDEFKKSLPLMGNQAKRIATRFALVATALQLAIDAKLLQLSHSDVAQGISQCLNDWAARDGTGNYEERQIIQNATAFFEQFAHNRFVYLDKSSSRENTPPNFAGLKEQRGESLPLYWVLPSVFESEICKDYDRAKAVQVFEAAGWLIVPGTGNHKTRRKSFNGESLRYYVFEGATPPSVREEIE